MNRSSWLKRVVRQLFREWIWPLGLTLLVVAPVRSAVVDWNWVPSGSMKPTILEGDMVLVNKLAYDLKIPFTTRHLAQWGDPQRGEVVVFFSPVDGTRLVKRVVGLPGDVVAMQDNVISVNGRALSYTPRDAAPYQREVFEDSHPVVAVEALGEHAHLVMALPQRSALRSFPPVVVPAGTYFVMGDSRDNSNDSRFIGPVARDKIVGRGVVALFSVDLKRYLPRFDRFLVSFDRES